MLKARNNPQKLNSRQSSSYSWTQIKPNLITIDPSTSTNPILILKIDMEDGRVEDFKIYSHLNLQTESINFCRKHNMPDDFSPNLTTFVKSQLENMNKSVLAPSKKAPKKKQKTRSNKETFDRLWHDATEGQKNKEILNKQKSDNMYTFQPNIYKGHHASTATKMQSKSRHETQPELSDRLAYSSLNQMTSRSPVRSEIGQFSSHYGVTDSTICASPRSGYGSTIHQQNCTNHSTTHTQSTSRTYQPSIRHDSHYLKSTTHDRSLSKIREKYLKDKESIYGYNMDENIDNYSITFLERAKLKTRQRHQNGNGKLQKRQVDNDFSKLIALANLFSGGEPTINVTKLDNIFETSIKNNQYFQVIVNELGMCELYEITPLDFIEWIQKKKLVHEASKAYDVFMSKGMFQKNKESILKGNGLNMSIQSVVSLKSSIMNESYMRKIERENIEKISVITPRYADLLEKQSRCSRNGYC